MKPTQIDQYQKQSFTAKIRSGQEVTHDVYTRSAEGAHKVVVIIQELPGIGQETLALADHFISEKYYVVMPHLFGPIGKTNTTGNFVRVLCMRREFHIFTSNQSSPVIDWLGALCQKARTDYQVKGVATIGMCLTGNFAISLMADDAVLAGYASQPSLPLGKQKGLHMSPEEIEKIKTKIDSLPEPAMAGRFEKDGYCKAAKFEALDQTFNEEDKTRVKMFTLPGKGHSIVTIHFVNEEGHPTKKALEEVTAYFDRMLG